MTPKEFAHATMLVASLRTRLGHANALTAAVTAERDDLAKQLAAHVESLTLSNAQCAEYLRHNEMLRAELDRISAERDTMQTKLHSELVNVRAALAATTEQCDSLRRTLDEWERADTKPHKRVTDEDVADHVVPPVLPICNVCHGCGGVLIVASNSVGCYNVGCRRTMTVPFREATVSPFHPYHGPCATDGACSHG